MFQFEEELRKRESPRIEVYLEKADASLRPELLSCLVKALLEEDGRDCLRQDEYNNYVNRFGDNAKLLEELLRPGAAFQPAESSSAFSESEDSDQSKSIAEPPGFNEPSPFGPLEYVGKGSYGRVYRTTLKGATQTIALKIASHPANQDRFSKAELELLKRLQQSGHPGIVQCIDGFEGLKTSDGCHVIVEEWIGGGTLRDYFEKAGKKVDYAESLRIVKQMVEALACIHQAGIFHLDLKMSNVMMREPFNQPTIVDFGGGVKRDNRDNAKVGTPWYLAPERLDNSYWDFQITARTDIFSVGVIFYQLLTGDVPFLASDKIELRESFLRRSNPDAPRSLVPGISEAINRICLKCLKINPLDRFSSAQELLDALSIVDEVVSARSPQQTVEQRVLKLLPMEQLDRPFYESLIAAAGQSPRFTNADSLIQQLRSRSTDAPKIIALSAPSGAGKSSWLRAWLLPELLQNGQTSICRLDATESDNSASEHTFDLLQHELRVHLSAASTDGTERSTAAELIREVVAGRQLSRNVKLLIVIDQFEQWLLRYGRDENSNLLNALRECNGHRVQALVIFRSDYENLVKPTMRRCEQAFHDGTNAFDLPAVTKPAVAAETLLHLLGAVGKFQDQADIPGSTSLRKSAEQLLGTTAGDAILPVQIVLLAKFCLKHTDVPNPLAGYDKFEDIVQLHVNELFQKSITNPAEHQLLLDIIRRLLPAGSSQARQATSLDNVVGLKKPSSAAPQYLLDCLKSNGVIMPVVAPTDLAPAPPAALWQLTHEFWIEPLRKWVDDQPQTDREKLLRKLTERWYNDRRDGNLPTFYEYLLVRKVTCCTSAETQLLAACQRTFKSRALAGIVILISLAFPCFTFVNQANTYKDIINTSTPAGLLDLAPIHPVFQWYVPIPQLIKNKLNIFSSTGIDSQIPCHIALLNYESINDSQNDASIQFLLDYLPRVRPEYQRKLIEAFTRHKVRVLPRLTEYVRNPKEQVDESPKHSRLAHLAILAVFLDRFDDAETALGPSDGDQSARSEFISRFEDWTMSVNWPSTISYDRLQNYPGLLSSILQSVDLDPLYGDSEVDSDAFENVRNLINDSLKHPHAAVASTAFYMNKKLSDINVIPTPVDGSNFLIDTHAGLILVDLGSYAGSGTPMWSSDTEITWGHFRKLCPDLLPETRKNQIDSDGLPATDLNPSLIFEFINRLNKKYSLPETYRRVGPESEDKWEPIPGAKGFRLPYLREFRAMAPAVATFYQPLGNELDTQTYWLLLPKYTNTHVFQTSAEKQNSTEKHGLRPVRSLRPNSLGLFDLLGNCSEIVVGDEKELIEKLHKDSLFGENSKLCVMGGDWFNPESATFLGNARNNRVGIKDIKSESIGFRVVCDGVITQLP